MGQKVMVVGVRVCTCTSVSAPLVNLAVTVVVQAVADLYPRIRLRGVGVVWIRRSMNVITISRPHSSKRHKRLTGTCRGQGITTKPIAVHIRIPGAAIKGAFVIGAAIAVIVNTDRQTGFLRTGLDASPASCR